MNLAEDFRKRAKELEAQAAQERQEAESLISEFRGQHFRR